MTTRNAELGPALIALGTAGVEVALHPSDPSRLRFRPTDLPADLLARLSQHRDALQSLMTGGYSPVGEDAAAVMIERLGIADDLGMPTHPGSPAWLIAVGESLAVGCADAVSVDMADAAIQNRIPALEGA